MGNGHRPPELKPSTFLFGTAQSRTILSKNNLFTLRKSLCLHPNPPLPVSLIFLSSLFIHTYTMFTTFEIISLTVQFAPLVVSVSPSWEWIRANLPIWPDEVNRTPDPESAAVSTLHPNNSCTCQAYRDLLAED